MRNGLFRPGRVSLKMDLVEEYMALDRIRTARQDVVAGTKCIFPKKTVSLACF